MTPNNRKQVATLATNDIDPNQIAREELAKAMIPTPDDVVTDLSPIAALFYLEQLGWAVLTSWTAYASEAAENNVEGADDLGVTLNQVAETVGRLDEICARIGLLPVEAVPPRS